MLTRLGNFQQLSLYSVNYRKFLLKKAIKIAAERRKKTFIIYQLYYTGYLFLYLLVYLLYAIKSFFMVEFSRNNKIFLNRYSRVGVKI